jgi:alkylation response protein AidB-like acyl-CoA dehydrogenase
MTEERRLIQQTARDFTMKEVLPVANELDAIKGDIPMSLRDQMADLGYFGMLIPEEYEGLGLGVFEYVLVTEELARAWMSVASIIARGNGLGGGFGEGQKRTYLPRMARGEFLGAFAMSEPEAGSDVANISCRAMRDGDDWVITGNKMWCTFADGADYITLVARTSDPEDLRRRTPVSACSSSRRSGGRCRRASPARR